jgi:hypothetical protein
MAPIWHIVIVVGLLLIGSAVVLEHLGLSLLWLLVIAPASMIVGLCGAMRDDD